MNKQYCASCSKQLGFAKYTLPIGRVCKECKFADIDSKPQPMTGLRVGVAVVLVSALILLGWSLLR